MATLDDLLTAQKNGVVAINNLNQTYQQVLTKMQYLAGSKTSLNISASTTVVSSGSGRLVKICVVAAGSTTGTVYVGSVAAANAVYTIQNTVGSYDVGAQFSGALIIVPGTGQTVSATYSQD